MKTNNSLSFITILVLVLCLVLLAPYFGIWFKNSYDHPVQGNIKKSFQPGTQKRQPSKKIDELDELLKSSELDGKN